VESSSKVLFLSHEAATTDPYDALGDVIGRVGILNNDSSLTPSIDWSVPSHKFPRKWLTRTP